MGGTGSGRKPDPTNLILRNLTTGTQKAGAPSVQFQTPIFSKDGEGLFIPNLSGEADLSSGTIQTQPVNNKDIANKQYVDAIRFTHYPNQARLLNTTYTNNTGWPMIIYGSISCTWNDDFVGGGNVAYFECLVGGTEVLQGGTEFGLYYLANNIAAQQSFPFGFFVPNGSTYRINSTTTGPASVTLEHWNELIVPAPPV